MEIRVLNYFLMVAREENITKAANMLHITQPTLSRQLMQLEQELGVKLFNRGHHNITLTEEGMLLKRRAQEIIALTNKTKEDIKQQTQNLSGEICIGSGEFYSSSFLTDMMAKFHEQHPLVTYQIYSGNADNIKERIENGLLDIGLLSYPVDINKYEFIRLPLKEEYGALMREDNPLASKKHITPQDLINIPLTVPQRILFQNELTNWFGDYRDNLNIIMSGNLLYNQAMMVRSGLGIAVTIRLNCSYDKLKFIPFYPSLKFNSVIVWKKSEKQTLATTTFLQYARQYIADLAK